MRSSPFTSVGVKFLSCEKGKIEAGSALILAAHKNTWF